MKHLILLTVVAASSLLAGEKPDDFNSILKRVESHYGKRHMKIPLMGLVSFASRMARPAGVSDFKFAIIEGAGAELGTLPEFHPGPQWRPFLRTTSRSGEQVVLYGREERHAIRTLMVVLDRNEAVVMQMRLNPEHFAKFVSDKAEHR